jgi:CheY-like chemotaxis protein
MTNDDNGSLNLQKILIAEDNKQTMQLMFRYFSKANERGDIVCELYKAFDGEEAIQKIEEEEPDLILCDIEMPKKNGFQVLEHFNETKASKPFMFFAFCSASQDERIKAFKMGAMGFISKNKIDYFVTTLQIQAWLKLASLERLKSSSLSK